MEASSATQPSDKPGRFIDGYCRGGGSQSPAVAPQVAPPRGFAASQPISSVVPPIVVAAATALPAGSEFQKPCTCKGHCGTKGNHSYANARSKEGTGKWVYPCKKCTTDASDFCSQCRCTLHKCARGRHKGLFCWRRQYRSVGLELQAMAVFQDTLVDMLPGDVACFLDVCSLDYHPVLLILMSQQWEPDATKQFACLTRNMKRLTGYRLVTVFLQVGQHLQQLTGDRAMIRRAWLHSQIEQGTGSQRILGYLALAQRLGLLKKVAESHQHQPSVIFSSGVTDDKYLFTDHAQRLDELITHMPRTWKKPQTLDEYMEFCAQVDSDLRSLPSWSNMGGNYLRPHVARKIILLADIGMQWRKKTTPIPRDVWEMCCPDQHAHLVSIPPLWNMYRVAAIAPRISPMYYSMWACLFGAATRQPRLRAWLEAQVANETTAAFNEAARRLIAKRHGVTPAPAGVVSFALES